MLDEKKKKQISKTHERVFSQLDGSTVTFRSGNFSMIDWSIENVLTHNLMSIMQYGNNQAYVIIISMTARYYKLVPNGLIVRSREKMTKRDIGIAKLFCTYPEFVVVTNDRNTAAMFARNVTSTPKT